MSSAIFELSLRQGFKRRRKLSNGVELWRMESKRGQIFWRAFWREHLVADWHDAPGLGALRRGGQINGNFAAADNLSFNEWNDRVAALDPAREHLEATRPRNHWWSSEQLADER